MKKDAKKTSIKLVVAVPLMFAFGFALDRLALMRHGIDDLRELFRNDYRFLSQF